MELIRYMVSRQATARSDGRERKTQYIDVKKAHLAALCRQLVFVELPEEAGAAPDECGRLVYWLYGCRPAAQAWEEHYAGVLQDAGFERLMASPVAFFHKERDLMGVVHGDDFIFTGVDEQLDFVLQVLRKEYELKDRGRLGSGEKDLKSVDMLGRRIRWHDWGLTWEGDSRHRDSVLEYFGMGGDSKALKKTGYKDKDAGSPGDGGDQELNPEECTAFRALAARLNYMAQDHPAIQFAAKEICRKMARPIGSDFFKIKRLARFLVGIRTVEWLYPWQTESDACHVKVFSDSDWAGCQETRRSTTGGLLMIGSHPLRTWSSTQSVVATSSAEAELYSMAEGASRGCGFKTVLGETGAEVQLTVSTDASAAKAFASTRGLGKMRHLEVKDLWIQALVKSGRVAVYKVRGEVNVADAMTKYLDLDKCSDLLALGGMKVVPIEHATGPRGVLIPRAWMCDFPVNRPLLLVTPFDHD